MNLIELYNIYITRIYKILINSGKEINSNDISKILEHILNSKVLYSLIL